MCKHCPDQDAEYFQFPRRVPCVPFQTVPLSPFADLPGSKPLFWLSALYPNLPSFWHFISRIIKYVFFCVQLLSPSIMLWDSFMLLPVAEVLCFFQFLCDTPLYEYNTIYPFCWQYLAIICITILNILIHVWMCVLTHVYS